MDGLVFHVTASLQLLEEMEKTRPPEGEESLWNIRRWTPTTVRPLTPLTENRRNDCFAGWASTHRDVVEPKLVFGQEQLLLQSAPEIPRLGWLVQTTPSYFRTTTEWSLTWIMTRYRFVPSVDKTG